MFLIGPTFLIKISGTWFYKVSRFFSSYYGSSYKVVEYLAKWAPLLSGSGITSVSASPGLCPLDSGTKISSLWAFNILFCRTLRVHCTCPSKSASAMPLPFSALPGAHKVCGHSPVQTIPELFEFVLNLQLDDLAVRHVYFFRDAEDCRGTLFLLFF